MKKKLILKKRKDFVRVAKGVSMVTSTVLLQAAPSLSKPKHVSKVFPSPLIKTDQPLPNVSETTEQNSSASNRKSANDLDYKVGFTTSKKLGKAHIRNRARRRLRAVAQEILPDYALAHTEYVLIGRFNTANCAYSKLKSDLLWAIQKTNRVLLGEEEAPQVNFKSKNKGGKVKESKRVIPHGREPQPTAVSQKELGDKSFQKAVPNQTKTQRSVLFQITLFPLVMVIKIYQKFLSPLCPGCCRYRPTCSQYMLDALKQHGLVKGLSLGIKRILRCHPWGGSGYDPVPAKNHTPTKR